MIFNRKSTVAITLALLIAVSSALAPLAYAQDEPAAKEYLNNKEYLRKRIVVKPVVSGKEITTESTVTMGETWWGAPKKEKTSTKTINPSEVEGYNIYRRGRKIGVLQFLRIIGEEQRVYSIERKIEENKKSKTRNNIVAWGLAGIGTYFGFKMSSGMMPEDAITEQSSSITAAVAMIPGLVGGAGFLTGRIIGPGYGPTTPKGFYDYEQIKYKARMYNIELREKIKFDD